MQGTVYHSHTDSKHSRGVCILLSNEFRGNVTNVVTDNVGRKLMVNINDNGVTYTLVNLYCPTAVKDWVEFLHHCKKWVKDNSSNSDNLILGGDVNCIDWPRDRVSLETDKSSVTLRNLKSVLKISDTWKFLHPETSEYTYIDPSFRNMNSRIEYIMC